MSEFIPKVADIATLKGISMLLSLPMVCVAYTLQTGLNISIGELYIGMESATEEYELARTIFIFTLKSLWISFFTIAAYNVLRVAHEEIEFEFVYISSVVLIALALAGLFGKDVAPALGKLNVFWFYSFIVWGVFLQTKRDEWNAST